LEIECRPVGGMKDLLLAREKRRLESLRVQKNILKSNSCALDLDSRFNEGGTNKSESSSKTQSLGSHATMNSEGNALSVELSSGTEKYTATLGRLAKYNKLKKASSQSRKVKEEWINEQKHLDSCEGSIMGDLCSILEVMVLYDPSDSDVVGMLAMKNAMEDRATHEQMVVQEHVSDIKNLILDSRKMKRKKEATLTQSDNDVGRSIISTVEHAEDSILANALLELRTGMSQQWTSLEKDESALAVQVASDYLNVSRMLKNDRRDLQNNCISLNLACRDDDDSEVLLAIEEWYAKIASVDQAHEETCRIIDGKRKRITTEYQNEISQVRESKSNDVSFTSGDMRNHRHELLTVESEDCPEFEHDVANEEGENTVTAFPGSWNREDHLAFVKVIRRCNSVGSSRGTLLGQWQALLPQKSRKELLRHEKWYRECRALADKKKLATCTYEKSRSTIVNEAREAIESLRSLRVKTRQEERIRKQQDEHRRLLHEQLMILRAEKQQESEERRIEQAREEKLRSQREISRREQWLKEQEDKKRLVVKFQNLRAEALAKRKKVDEELYVEQQNQIRRLIECNRGKVEGRELKRLEKKRQRQQKLREKEEEETKRLEILANLAMAVPYWDAIENASSQLDHVTAAAKAQEWQQPEELSRGFLALNGFGDKKIIRDARFRLAEALRGAGIAQSKVAAEVVKEYHPRPQLAIMGILYK
jgi:hypothetical protein